MTEKKTNPQMVGRKRGTPKTGGRKKGTPNKVTAELKEAIEDAFRNVGGAKYLEKQAALNPVAFMTLLRAILPKDINVGGQQDNELVIKIKGI